MNDFDLAPLGPAEKMALRVAFSQLMRGEEMGQNCASICVVALARLTASDEIWYQKAGE